MLQNRKDRVHGSSTKDIEHILEILINVKAGRVKWGARKVYHGCRVGQACCRLCLELDKKWALVAEP
jgi:hypothetical protein